MGGTHEIRARLYQHWRPPVYYGCARTSGARVVVRPDAAHHDIALPGGQLRTDDSSRRTAERTSLKPQEQRAGLWRSRRNVVIERIRDAARPSLLPFGAHSHRSRCRCTTEEIAAHGYMLTPGRYMGAADMEEDDEPFESKLNRLRRTLFDQFDESQRLEARIREQLAGVDPSD